MARGWSQAELARELGMSQARLSMVERGEASLTAEQFLTVLQMFNATTTDFVARVVDAHAELQNALARQGALHLNESDRVLPSERLDQVTDVVRETLVVATPRLLSALAPVLARHAGDIGLHRLYSQLMVHGHERRLAWVVDNTRGALEMELRRPLSRSITKTYRRAEVILNGFLESTPSPGESPYDDILDETIRSKKTIAQIRVSSSEISKRWGIVSALQVADFVEALESAQVNAG